MFCPRCGTQLPEEAVFCYKCGAKIGLLIQARPSSGGSGQVVAPGGATALKCPNCVGPDTLILGDNKPISEMSVGDQVIGMSGIEDVAKTFVRNYTGEMIRIKAEGILPIELTPEHPVLTVRRSMTHQRMGEARLSPEVWRHAHGVKRYDWERCRGDYLVVPIPRGQFDTREVSLQSFTSSRGLSITRAKGYGTSFPIRRDTASLLGLYVAEGCATKNEVVFFFGKNEKELQRKVMNTARRLGYSPYSKNTRTAVAIGIPSRLLSRAFAHWCGKGARNKKIPDFVLLHRDKSIIKSFFEAVVAGDGYQHYRRGIRNACITTVSKLLAMQFQLLSARLGFHFAIHQVDENRVGTILRRQVRIHEKFQIRGKTERGSREAMKSDDQFLYTPVRRIERFDYSGPVHNLTTLDGTFLVSNAVVHNCGAPIAPKFGEMIITCEYCGSSVSLASDGWRSIQKHTMLPLKLSQQSDVLNVVRGQMDRGLLHRHLMEQSTMEELNLAMVPYWLVPVSARTSLVAVDMAAEAGSIATTAVLAGMLGGAMSDRRGGGGMMGGVLLGTMLGGGIGGGQNTRRAYQMDKDYNYPIVALKALTEYQPKDYQFRLAERTLFDATKVKGVKVMNGDVGEDTAKYQAKTMVDQLQSEKAHAEHHMIQQLSTESDVGEAELLHAPVWFTRYDHKGSKIVLVVDGNSGGIINSIGL